MSHEAESAAEPEKNAVRRDLRARRRSLAPQRDRSADAEAIATAASTLLDTRLLAPSHTDETPNTDEQDTGKHPTYDGRACVAIYRSLPMEPPTEALAAMLHARRVQVIVPETLPDFDLEWRELRADGSEGPRLGPDGIAMASVIFAPALSVDHTGTRLGQGGGCYDRALPRRRPDAVIVAIVHDQEYAAGPLPHDPHDVRMDATITPGGGLSPTQHPVVVQGGPGSVP